MRKIFTILAVSLYFHNYAINRYVKLTGSDGNVGTIGAPWLTIGKVNTSALANDSVFFYFTDAFFGTLLPTKNGVYYGTYGGGTKATLTGFTTISGWTNEGNGIYSKAITAEAQTNMVLLDGVQQAMGRYPDNSYLQYQTNNSNLSITDPSLTDVPNWTGAEVVIRKANFDIRRNLVTSQSSGVISYTPVGQAGFTPTPLFGYFFQNDLRTLTTLGEWYHDFTNGKFYMYFGSVDPTLHTVKVATLSNCILSNTVDNVVFDNLSITGAINNNIKIQFGQDNWKIKNCDISYAGNECIEIRDGSTADSIYNNTITFSNGYGVYTIGIGTVVYNNTVSDIAKFPGQSQAEGGSYTCIYMVGNGSIAQNNTVKRCGGGGVYADHTGGSTVFNNRIDSMYSVINDGGAIYAPAANVATRRIDGNIISNSIGNTDGTNNSLPSCVGIYCDEFASNDSVVNNTIFNTVNAIKNNKGANNYIHDNTTFDNTFTYDIEEDQTGGHVRNLSIRRNIFVQKLSTQYSLKFYYPGSNDIAQFGTADSNYYAKPIDDNLNFTLRQPSIGTALKNLAGWQAFSNQDLHSKKSPKAITNVNQLNFYYNYSSVPTKAYFAGFSRIDMRGTIYNDSATIPPYRSIVLIDSGIVAPIVQPTANAGSDTSIILPTVSMTATATATLGSGTTGTYQWAFVSGPSIVTFGGVNSLTTTINNLTTQGTYTVKFTVTNNQGNSASDTRDIIVKPAIVPPNQPPVSVPGSNQNITLPTNTVTFNGSGSFDPDGTISAYEWTLFGPSIPTNSNPNGVSTTFGNLVQGFYNGRLKVTDNLGDTGSASFSITVKAPLQPPTAIVNPIPNPIITLPTNSVTIFGSGIVYNGATISSYLWTDIAGNPSSGTIVSPTSANTLVSNLLQGTYNYQLEVTDSNGKKGVAIMTVTVNPVPPANIPALLKWH